MRISVSDKPPSAPSRDCGEDRHNADAPSGPSHNAGRGLIVVEPLSLPQQTAQFRNPRPSAVFITQLIATAEGAPQTRARRRSGPDHAAAVYAAAAHDTRASIALRSI